MLHIKKIFLKASTIFIMLTCVSYAQESSLFPFWGMVNADSVNMRSDSTVNSSIICNINRGEQVEVIQELYDWYKIRLPKTAPSFIKKNLVILIDNKTGKVLKNRVNIRMKPSETAAVIGKANKDEIVNILDDVGQWYKIEPLNNSFGWIHKKFIKGQSPSGTGPKGGS